MPDKTFEQLAQDINQRLDSLGTPMSDERVKELITECLSGLKGDEDFVRKLRFGPQGAPELVGTKYARWGLSVDDVEFLYDMMANAKGQTIGGREHPGPSEELTRTFSAISQARYLSEEQVRAMDQTAIDGLFARLPRSAFHGSDRTLAERGAWELTEAYKRAIRAMDTGESGFGQQLVGAGYVGALWEAPRREGRIFPLLNSFEMTAPTEYLPVEVDFPEMLFVAENTANNSSEYGTSKTGSQRVQVDAKKFVIHQMWSGEMEEDSIIPFIPFLRRQASIALAFYADSLVLNGDTTNAATGNINLDDADPADTKHYLAFDGIRHAGLVDNTANSKDAAGAVTLALLNEQRGRLIDTTRKVDWGHPNDPSDLVYVADPETADKVALLEQIATVDKYGPQATVLTGEIAKILGHPLVTTPVMSRTEADGKVSTTGANNTKGQVTCFNRRGMVVGWRRRVKTEVERLPARDQTRIVHSLRLGAGRFTPTGNANALEFADTLYNIT